ncbi:hypothetical protein KI387_039883, partial [Taxus chinensis]
MADGMEPNGKPGAEDENNKDTVAKTAGIVVFTGIALSLFKAMWPKNATEKSVQSEDAVLDSSIGNTFGELKEDAKEKAEVQKEVNGFVSEFEKKFQKGDSKKKSGTTIEIFKGDTLWDLSQKYGVSIDSIKAANGLTDDMIYA